MLRNKIGLLLGAIGVAVALGVLAGTSAAVANERDECRAEMRSDTIDASAQVEQKIRSGLERLDIQVEAAANGFVGQAATASVDGGDLISCVFVAGTVDDRCENRLEKNADSPLTGLTITVTLPDHSIMSGECVAR